MCVSKAREWPHDWQMPGPRAVKNLQMPHPQDWQGEQMPHSRPVGELGAGGIDWCIRHLSINGLPHDGGGRFGGVQPTGNLTFSGCQMSITPPLGLHFESHFHPWGELIGTHNSLYCVNDIWNKSYNRLWTAEMKWKWRNDRCSERNLHNSQLRLLCNCVKKPEKSPEFFSGGFFTNKKILLVVLTVKFS